MESINGKWSNKISNIRTIALLLVVFGHSIIIYSSSWDLYSTVNDVFVLDSIKKIIDIIQMPLFFSISGFLFYFTHKKGGSFVSLVKNKMKRLIIPYFMIGFTYMLPIRIVIGYKGYEGASAISIIEKFLKVEDVGHLWFLPALFFIFIFCEIILKIFEKILFFKPYSWLLLFGFSVVLYLYGYIICFGYSPFLAAVSHMIWFCWGYVICKFMLLFEKIGNHKVIKCVGIIVSIVLLYVCTFENCRLFIQLACKFVLILNIYMMITEANVVGLKEIARNSFGIYLFHSPLVYITYTYFPNLNPIILVVINFVGFGGCAMILTWFIRKSRIKFVLGE